MKSLPLIALVGRTNVGKSTLFNSLLGYKRSLVDNHDGLTRDCLLEPLTVHDKKITLVDTGGLDRQHSDCPIDKAFMTHTWSFLKHVDHCFYVLDGAVGLTDADMALITKLQTITENMTFIWNKADLVDQPKIFDEVRRLTKKDYFLTSFHDPFSLEPLREFIAQIAAEAEEVAPDLYRTFGFFGRPNVGKSSLSNALVRSQKFLVSEKAGTTRDFNAALFNYEGETLKLIDTAGIIPNAQRHPQMLERMTYYRTLVAVKQVSVGVLVIDAEEGLTAQDLKILNLLEQHRRGLIIVLNKWDLLDDSRRTIFLERIQYHLKAYAYCPLIPMSAKTKYNVGQLLEAVMVVMESFTKTISTGQVNKALETALKQHQPPLNGLHRIKLRYAHVVDTNPLTIMIHGNQLGQLPGHYKKYLINSFCKQFGLAGVPLKLEFKNTVNPYVEAG